MKKKRKTAEIANSRINDLNLWLTFNATEIRCASWWRLNAVELAVLYYHKTPSSSSSLLSSSSSLSLLSNFPNPKNLLNLLNFKFNAQIWKPFNSFTLFRTVQLIVSYILKFPNNFSKLTNFLKIDYYLKLFYNTFFILDNLKNIKEKERLKIN